MTLNVDIPPHVSARLAAFARQRGIDSSTAVTRIVTDYLPPVGAALTAEGDSTSALLEAWLREDATDDPVEARQAEEELLAFQRGMNAGRAATGERLPFPDVAPGAE